MMFSFCLFGDLVTSSMHFATRSRGTGESEGALGRCSLTFIVAAAYSAAAAKSALYIFISI